VAVQVTGSGSTQWAVQLGGSFRDMDPAVAVAPASLNNSTPTVYLAGSFRSRMQYNGGRNSVNTVVLGTQFRDLFLATVRPTVIRLMRIRRIRIRGGR
jgi:hypothetical protein